MRRLTVKYAKPGMVIELPVYDYYGNQLVAQHKKLEQSHIDTMIKKGVPEIFILDYRVTDVVVAPLFSPYSEGVLASSCRYLIQQFMSTSEIEQDCVEKIQEAVYGMIRDMSLNIIGDINVSCHIPPQDYIYLQPVKTAGLSIAIGKALQLTESQMMNIGMAALLKDIGLPVDLITDGGSIADDNSPRIRRHPIAGYKILTKQQSTDDEIAETVLQHHEFWSGSGYPQGLKGEEISLYARIISIADAFVDLLAERPSGERYMPHEAIEYIMANSGDQFDPELVELFVRQVPSYATGLMIKLNTGEKGIISDPKLGFVARPIVRICSTAEKGALEKTYDIDLSQVKYQRKLITKVLGYD